MNFYLPVLLICCALIQLVLGGLVQAQPGLMCVDWPLCYGRFAPAPSDSAFYEIAHRALALLLALGSAALLKRRHEGRHVYLPLFWVLVQALLGWITFSYQLPTLVSLAHLVLLPIYIFSVLQLLPLAAEEKLPLSRHAKDVPLFFFFAFLMLFVLGGLIRKTGVGLVNVPEPLAQLKLAHRVLGTGLVVALSLTLGTLSFKFSRLRTLLFFPMVLGLWQFVIGVALWRSTATKPLLMLHLAGAGLLLTSLLYVRRKLVQLALDERPGWLDDLLLLTKARLGLLVMATVLVGMLVAPFQLTFLSSLGVFIGIAMQAMGACALNCVIEKDIDALMERTRIRPLPSGRMSVATANLIGWGLVAVGTALILITSNSLTAVLGVLTVLIYLYAYTPLKTRSPWALVVGAIPGATPPLMGWTAVTDEISGAGWYLFLFLFFWQLPHFLAIAVYHQKDYANARILTFFRDQGSLFVKRSVLCLTIVLTLISFYLYDGDGSGAAYHTATLLMGGVFFGLALQGWLMKDEGEEFRRWARTYFLATIFYLPLQLSFLLMLL